MTQPDPPPLTCLRAHLHPDPAEVARVVEDTHHLHPHPVTWHHAPVAGECEWEARFSGVLLTCDRAVVAYGLCRNHLADAWIAGAITFLPSGGAA